jgi:hypothetical protein
MHRVTGTRHNSRFARNHFEPQGTAPSAFYLFRSLAMQDGIFLGPLQSFSLGYNSFQSLHELFLPTRLLSLNILLVYPQSPLHQIHTLAFSTARIEYSGSVREFLTILAPRVQAIE